MNYYMKISVVIFIVVLFIIVFILMINNFKSRKTTDFDNSFYQEDLDNRSFPVRQLYKNYNIPFRFDVNGEQKRLTGLGQTIAVIANVLSGWYVEDILRCLVLDNGIQNKTFDQLLLQIRHIDCTDIVEPFTIGEYENLHVPISDGINSQIPLTDPIIRKHSLTLSIQLQNILAIAPDANIIIFYFGTAPIDCEEEDTCPTIEDYREVVIRLYDRLQMEGGLHRFNIVCNAVSFEANDNIMENVHETLNDIVKNNIQTLVDTYKISFLSSTGDDGRNVETLPQIIYRIITIGGTERLYNGIEQAYRRTNGGMYVCDDNGVSQTGPSEQLGYVPFPPDIDNPWNVGFPYIGRPDIAGCATNLSFYFDKGISSVKRYEGTDIPVAVYSGLLSLVNQLTDYNMWDYLDIFYREATYLFREVNKGSNLIYNASHYKNWNPLCGLGRMDVDFLCKLLVDKYAMTNKKIQLYSPFIQNQMSYINFFPISPVLDPINLLPSNDYYHSQPVFGPCSLWSELTILKVDPNTHRLLSSSEPEIIRNGDIILILSNQKYSRQMALKYTDYSRNIEIAECSIDNVNIPIPDNILWTIEMIDETTDTGLLLYQIFRIKSRSNPNLYLTADFTNNLNTLNPNASSPSLTDTPELLSTLFSLSLHPYSLLDNNYKENFKIESSYYLNITNENKFIVSGFDYSFSHTTSYETGILRASDIRYNLPRPVYQDFDGRPEWLFIPIHKNIPENLYKTLNFELSYTNHYMLYNPRIRAYMYALDFELRLMNVNFITGNKAFGKDIYHYMLFSISGNNNEPFDIFTPMSYPTSPFKVNPFLGHITLYQEPPYYSENISEAQYQLYRLTNTPTPDTAFVQFNGVIFPVQPNLYLFWVNPQFMCKTYEDVKMSPAFPYNGNNRFLGTCISYCGNDILCMKPIDKTNFEQQWTILGVENVTAIQSSSFLMNYMIFSPDTSQFTFENHFKWGAFIGYPDGGWIPRIQVWSSDKNWRLIPNYNNVITSQIPNTLSLTNNYLYLFTFYNIDCPKGVMSCCLNGPHVPGLIRQNIENEDNIIYGSQLYLFK